MVVCFINPIGLNERPFPSAFCRPLLELELEANETRPKTALVERELSLSCGFEPGNKGRGSASSYLATMRGTACRQWSQQCGHRAKNGERIGFWSHNSSNWIKPPLKPIPLLSYRKQSILTVSTRVSFDQLFLVDYLTGAEIL